MTDNQSNDAPIWQYIALDSHPPGKKVKGIVRAYTVEDVIQEIRGRGFFPIEIKLPKRGERQRVQARAITASVIERLKRNGIAAELEKSGVRIVLSKYRQEKESGS
ncbi:MAG: hypothetical protein AAB358_00915 [Patescibacteria group bacterium]